MSEDTAARWADALHAAALFAVDPAGCGGVLLRAGAGPVREAWLAQLREGLGGRPLRRLPLHIGDERLLGGLDLSATLQAGRAVAQRGLLAEADGGVLVVAMAERLPPATAARLAAVLDHGEVRVEREGLAQRHAARFGVVALDEGQGDDDPVPAALRERMALVLELDEVPVREAQALAGDVDAPAIEEARRRLAAVCAGDDVVQALTGAAAALGIASLRPPLLALRVACVAAALDGCGTVQPEHAALATRLVLAPRATRWPAAETEDEAAQTPPEPPPPAPPDAPPEPPPPDGDTVQPPPPDVETLADVLLQAAQAALPAGLLARLKAEQSARERARGAGKSGAAHKSAARGRPAGVRRGPPRAGSRLSLIDTLRAAAPWQRLRVPAPGARIRVHAEDFHVTRLRQRRETTTVFVVDASGSAALHRLAEAKGAVELLLADCYVRRDRVAVLAFRGRSAELLLPPTRSLVRAKRSLAGLPGGGGTPLAAALDATAALVETVRRRGETPLVVLLTDGRANVARDGSGGRARAEEDALAAARTLGAGGTAVLLVDTSPHPQPQARRLAEALRATYLPLPHGAAQDLSRVVRASGARSAP